MTERRFPPPWSVDDPDTKLGQDCFIVRDANSYPLAYVARRSRGRRVVAKLLPATKRGPIAANITQKFLALRFQTR